MEPKSPSKLKLSFNELDKYKKVLKICLVGFVILILIIGAYVVLNHGRYSDLVGNVGYYTVVVDCGSSGTRVNVFKWKRIGSGELPVLLHSYRDNTTDSVVSRRSCKYHCMQTEPGLHKFVGNSSGVRDSLEPLIQLAKHWVPSERHGETPIFVLATAGLRQIDVEDSTWVLDEVEKVVKEHSFLYRKDWIRILSGKEEAYYGWVALNYKMGSLGNSTRGHTLGLLDMGGSSLQVVMEIDGGARETTHLMTSKLGSIEHQLLAYSFPSFGLNEAFDRAVTILGNSKEVGTCEHLTVRHPCLGYDFAQNYSCHACDWLNITYQNGVPKSDVTYLVGDPDWEHCKGLARATAINSSSLTWSQPTVDTDCSTNLLTDSGAYTPSRFHALSGFFAVYNVLDLGPPTNMSEIWEKGKELCHNYWSNFNNTFRNQDHLRNYCFRVPYMASLIEEALCVGDKELIFGPGDISWTLGAALVEGEYLWLTATKSSVSLLIKTEFISSPIFVFLLLASLLLIVYCSQFKLPMPSKKVSAARPILPSQVFSNRRPR